MYPVTPSDTDFKMASGPMSHLVPTSNMHDKSRVKISDDPLPQCYW